MRPLPVPGYGLIRMTGPLRWAALLLEKVCVQAEDKQTGLKLQPQQPDSNLRKLVDVRRLLYTCFPSYRRRPLVSSGSH